MDIWNLRAKRFLKSELVKRGISNTELAKLLKNIGVNETKSSLDSKISRGSFSASFLFQCLSVIGCNKIDVQDFKTINLKVAETQEDFIV